MAAAAPRMHNFSAPGPRIRLEDRGKRLAVDLHSLACGGLVLPLRVLIQHCSDDFGEFVTGTAQLFPRFRYQRAQYAALPVRPASLKARNLFCWLRQAGPYYRKLLWVANPHRASPTMQTELRSGAVRLVLRG